MRSVSISLPLIVRAQIEEIKRIGTQLLNTDVTSIEAIGGGRNSQVYRVSCGDSQVYALKAYFRHASDNRERLRTEFSSLYFLWENGIRNIPRPIAAEWELGYAIYEYINGQKVATDAVTKAEVDTAVFFLTCLKDLKGRAENYSFAPAAEACFSVQAIVENIQWRLSRFAAHRTSKESCADLYEFLDHHFVPRFKEIIRWCQMSLDRAQFFFAQDIDPTERTLSPSDFGFHNALKRNNGELVFLDFEYFGWDDAAKMVADVLLHPGMSLSENVKQRFAHGILRSFADYPNLAKRVEIVYPLFGLKWCLILLNEFLPEHLMRRSFAGIEYCDRCTLQIKQLIKAQCMLQTTSENYEHFPYFN